MSTVTSVRPGTRGLSVRPMPPGFPGLENPYHQPTGMVSPGSLPLEDSDAWVRLGDLAGPCGCMAHLDDDRYVCPLGDWRLLRHYVEASGALSLVLCSAFERVADGIVVYV